MDKSKDSKPFFEDYETICPTHYNMGSNVTAVKVKKRLTQEPFYNLLEIDFKQFKNDESITQRINSQHPSLLNFITSFKEGSKVFVLTEFCTNGNLDEFISNCSSHGKYLREELICRLVYQVLCALKTVEKFTGKLDINEIFLDDDFNVKLFNFNLESDKCRFKTVKMSQVGKFLYNLCVLKPYDKTVSDLEIKKVNLFYSSSVFTLLNSLLEDHSCLYKHIDKILCNRTILLKSSQWRKGEPFLILPENESTEEISNIYQKRIQNLKQRELSVQIKEEKLNERERQLTKREKKIILMEKLVKDKLTRAEIYLNTNRGNRKMENVEDTSFSADCGDSSVILNSGRVNYAPFSRKKSERIRFKGHSPLKEISYNSKRRSFKKGETRSSTAASSSGSKKLFSDTVVETASRPLSWTEGSKKYAFDLLRIMNGAIDKEKCNEDMKHTFL